MLIQEKFVSTTELQQNISKTIDKVKQEDIIIIRNNKLEAAIISIEKYNQFIEYLEWKKMSDALDNMPIEYVSEDESQKALKLLAESKEGPRYSSKDIEKMIENGVNLDEL